MLKLWMRDTGRADDGDAVPEGGRDGALSEQVLDTQSSPKSVTIEAVDLEGNGTKSIIVAAEIEEGIKLDFFSLVDGTWSVHESLTRTLPVRSFAGTIYRLPGIDPVVQIATGNLDLDAGDEVVVVVNEMMDDDWRDYLSWPEGRWPAGASYWVFDDAQSGLRAIRSGVPAGHQRLAGTRVETPPYFWLPALTIPLASTTFSQADVAIGDFDNDGVDEIALSGLVSGHSIRRQDEKSLGFLGYRILDTVGVVVLDDLRKDLTCLATFGKVNQAEYPRVGSLRSLTQEHRRYVTTDALNVDGRGGDEIRADRFVLELVLNADGSHSTQSVADIPQEVFFSPAEGVTHFTHVTADVAIGDVNGDGREDIAIIHGQRDRLHVFGMRQPDPMVAASFGQIEDRENRPLGRPG